MKNEESTRARCLLSLASNAQLYPRHCMQIKEALSKLPEELSQFELECLVLSFEPLAEESFQGLGIKYLQLERSESQEMLSDLHEAGMEFAREQKHDYLVQLCPFGDIGQQLRELAGMLALFQGGSAGGDKLPDFVLARPNPKELGKLARLKYLQHSFMQAYTKLILSLDYNQESSFMIWRKEALSQLMPLHMRGFLMFTELKYQAQKLGLRGQEYLLQYGNSVQTLRPCPLTWLRFFFLSHRLSGYHFLKQAVAFNLVGGLGTSVNLGLFYLLVDTLGYASALVMLLGFWVSTTQNYTMNYFFTFGYKGKGLFWKKYLPYLGSYLLGLGVNYGVFYSVEAWFQPSLQIYSMLSATAFSTVVNFIMSKLLIFR